MVLIDPERCIQLKTGKCKKTCAEACDRNAIDFEQKEETVEVDVGAIIVSTGFETFDAARLPQYGYGKYPNVYTGLEVERLTSASGPTAGEVVLRDGSHPKSVAIIHCVGSRDENTNRWCSRVCCMYSLKLAHMVKDHTGANVYNFYIDMRTPGKSYEEFYDKLLSEGVHFIRGRVAEVTDWAIKPEEEGKLVIRVEDTLVGVVRRIPVDMVILSTGLEPQSRCGIGGVHVRHKPVRGRFFRRGPPEAETGGDEYGRRLSRRAAARDPGTCPIRSPMRGSRLHGHRAPEQEKVTISPTVAAVDEKLCSACKTCLSICPYQAILFERGQECRLGQRRPLQGMRHLRGRLPRGGDHRPPFLGRADRRPDRMAFIERLRGARL